MNKYTKPKYKIGDKGLLLTRSGIKGTVVDIEQRNSNNYYVVSVEWGDGISHYTALEKDLV